MSRQYEVSIDADVSGLDKATTDSASDEISDVIDDWVNVGIGGLGEPFYGHIMSDSFVVTLSGGDSVEDFASKFAKEVFARVGKTFPLDIHVVYIEQAPTETFSFGAGEGGSNE